MNDIERSKLAQKIVDCAFFYGKYDLTKDQIMTMINLINSVFGKSFDEIIKAYDLYMNDHLNKFFPAPAHLRKYIENEKEAKEVAINFAVKLATLIREKGRSFEDGYWEGFDKHYWRDNNYNKVWSFECCLRSFIGATGVEIVSSLGGWLNVCDLYFNSENSHFIAQIRDYAISLLKENKELPIMLTNNPKEDNGAVSIVESGENGNISN